MALLPRIDHKGCKKNMLANCTCCANQNTHWVVKEGLHKNTKVA